MKQIIFKDLENNTIQAGFMDDNGNVYCACCGGKFEADEENETFEVLKESDTWSDIQALILENQELYDFIETINGGETK